MEELGDDAIIAQQLGAHAPQPRAQVTEEARSIVISDHPAPGSNPPSDPRMPRNSSSGGRRRSERTEKTVVIRDRRQVEELRRQMAQHQERLAAPPAAQNKSVVLWVIVGVAAFLAGGLVALFATREESVSPAQLAPAPSAAAAPKAPPTPTGEPPSVSIDELPIEHK